MKNDFLGSGAKYPHSQVKRSRIDLLDMGEEGQSPENGFETQNSMKAFKQKAKFATALQELYFCIYRHLGYDTRPLSLYTPRADGAAVRCHYCKEARQRQVCSDQRGPHGIRPTTRQTISVKWPRGRKSCQGSVIL